MNHSDEPKTGEIRDYFFEDVHEHDSSIGGLNGTPVFLHPRKREELFKKGQELFNDEKFFEAHEEWEKLWVLEQGRDRSFLQALIQIAGHFVLLKKQTFSGAIRLAELAKQKLIIPPANQFYRQVDTLPLTAALNFNLEKISLNPNEKNYESFLIPKLF